METNINTEMKEKYTNPIKLYTRLHIYHTYSSVKSVWVSVATYDSSGTFLRRTVLINSQQKLSFDLRYTPLGDEYYAVVSYRSYGEGISIEFDVNSVYELLSSAYFDKTVEMKNTNILSINHRGYNRIAPENTISAYKLSKRNGFDYVETDVSFTKDEVAVCLHDSTIDRTSNGTGNISDLTLEDVRKFDFGSWKSDKYIGEKIPTFEEFILLCKNIGLHPYIELKHTDNYSETQIRNLVDIVKKYGMTGKVTWISFNPVFLKNVKDYDDKARLGFIVGEITSDTITWVKNLKCDNNKVFVDAANSLLTNDAVNECIAENIPIEVWTVNDVNSVININPYISGITSDYLLSGELLLKNTI